MLSNIVIPCYKKRKWLSPQYINFERLVVAEPLRSLVVVRTEVGRGQSNVTFVGAAGEWALGWSKDAGLFMGRLLCIINAFRAAPFGV